MITLVAIPDCAIKWLTDYLFWNQFARKGPDGYGRLVRLRKIQSNLTSWNIVLAWLQAPERLDGRMEGLFSCDLTLATVTVEARIYEKEIIFILKNCALKTKKR